MEQREFTSSDVTHLSGISYRQLQWWTEKRVLPCRMEGHTRRFYTWEVVRAMVIHDLRKRGVSLHQLRKMSASLDRAIDQALKTTEDRLIATDRRTMRLFDPGEDIRSLPEWLRGVFLIPVSEYIQKIEIFKPPTRLQRHRANVRRALESSADWMRGTAV